jgi:Domain of unknown function (DUF4328)
MAYPMARPAAAAQAVRTPANITISLLVVTMVVDAWRIATAAQGADDDASTLVAALVFVLTGLAFIQWLYRARRNLDELGATGLRWRPSWAIGGWFIPVANLVIPLLVVREIDRADPQPRPGRWIFAAWATTWTVYSVPSYGFVQDRDGADAEIALQVVGIVAAVCAILLVRRITASQGGPAPAG